MNKEKTQYQTFLSPNIKIKPNLFNMSRNYNNTDTKINYTINDKDEKYNKRVVNFLSSDTLLKQDLKVKISPSSIKLPKNSILKKYKPNIKLNETLSNFFDETINLKTTNTTINNLTLKKYNKDLVSSLTSNKTLLNNNNYNNNDNKSSLYEINKENNKILNNDTNKGLRIQKIFYPYISHDRKFKHLSLKKNIKIKNKFTFSDKGKRIRNNFFDNNNDNNKIYNSIDNRNRTSINFSDTLFPTSINEINNNKEQINNANSEPKYEKNKFFKTENNYYFNKKDNNKNNSVIKLNKQKTYSIDKNRNIILSRFKEYKRQIEPNFSLMEKAANNISKDIITNPFMRKIENLNDFNKFEILFHKSLMENILEIKKKAIKGFFQGNCWGMLSDKHKSSGSYISESKANVFNISEMIDRMSPQSCLKFNEILKKDYKEFLSLEKRKHKNKSLKKEDELRKRLIKKYNKELYFENKIAEKYNIKKNEGIKFIHDEYEEENNIDEI